jgi:fused signal recognition particle receptor
MFDFLKKKLNSLLGKTPEKAKRAKTAKAPKKEKKSKSSKKEVKADKEIKKEQNVVAVEPTKPIEQEEAPKQLQEELVQEEQHKEKAVEQEIEQPQEKKGGFFSKLFNKITTSKLSKKDFDSAFEELEMTLLENNVAIEAVEQIKSSLSEKLVNQQIKKSEAQKKIIDSLKEAILSVLIEPPNLIEQIKSSNKPYTILFFGINGAGKTTGIAKIAHLLQKNKISCVMAAADTFRAASIEQINTHGERLGIPVVSQTYGSDPAAVAYDTQRYAEKHGIKAILIDTAGRMYTKENLLKEMEKIVRVSKPDLKIFVGESITGNDAIEQARTFNETIGIDGIMLSKADVDEKAGTILSVSQVTGKPIYFLGTGQGYDDLTPFTKKTVLKNLGLD